MVIELTHGGYLEQETVKVGQISELQDILTEHMDLFSDLRSSGTSDSDARTWILDVMSVRCEWVFKDPSYLIAFIHYAHAHVAASVGQNPTQDKGVHENEIALIYTSAILKNIIKADKAMARATLLHVYQVKLLSEDFRRFNENFERLSNDNVAKSANIRVRRISAPLHIIRAAFFDEEKSSLKSITTRHSLLAAIDREAQRQYELARTKLNNGIVRSIIFLIITKVLIGVAIEVPVDLWLYGHILILPLLINLLAPPVFMLVQRVTLKIPGQPNTEAIKHYVDRSLYVHPDSQTNRLGSQGKLTSSISRMYTVLYALFSIGLFAWFAWRLAGWGFNIVQGGIFFVFLSTATFLGYRLSLIVKDLELIQSNQSILGLIRDFIYSPFVFLGQRISNTYSRFNVIALVLDFAIELPLKTVLRYARQWMRFLEDKKDMIG